MRLHALPLALLLTLAACSTTPTAQTNTPPAPPSSPTVVTAFDSDWRFHKGDTPDAQAATFNDGSWRQLKLPHDWSIEGPYDQNAITLRGGGFLPAGIGWYRKSFTVPASAQGKKVFLDFDGVMANSEVWINGQSLGKRPYGYISFRRDLTPHLKFDGPNVLAVRCDNTAQPASRWYAGAGIYRHTRLVIANPVHVEHWGTHVSTPQVQADRAVVRIRTSILNETDAPQDVALTITLHDAGGKQVAQANLPAQPIAPAKAAPFEKEFTLDRPKLWDITSPHLYRATIAVNTGNDQTDVEHTTFGVRSAEFRADTGFWLNGRNIKLKGVCLHHDAGALGAAVPLSVWERRFEAMRGCGANAIRTGHKPMSPEWLDLCDRMGILVMEESFDTWTAAKPNGGQGYNRIFNEWWEADTRDMVLRDRNHPSIIVWSCGNEIRDNLSTQAGKDRFTMQRDLYHRFDGGPENGGRPVTFALFRPTQEVHYAAGGVADLMDLVGQNYNEANLIAAWKAKPTRKIIGTENQHGRPVWLAMRDNPFYSGQFLWTGIDYLGEADWPRTTHGSGLVDRILIPRARAFERQAWWSEKPVVHIVRGEGTSPAVSANEPAATSYVKNWTPANPAPGAPAILQVYSNCDEVELILNGRSLGGKPKNADDAPRTWDVPFEPGTLQAVARNKGQVVARDELRTAGKPVKVALTSDRQTLTPSFEDVAFIYVSLQDANGVMNPNTSEAVTFTLTGPGELLTDNGNLTDHTPYQSRERRLHNGNALAIVRATGEGPITLTATAPGMQEATTKITAARKR